MQINQHHQKLQQPQISEFYNIFMLAKLNRTPFVRIPGSEDSNQADHPQLEQLQKKVKKKQRSRFEKPVKSDQETQPKELSSIQDPKQSDKKVKERPKIKKKKFQGIPNKLKTPTVIIPQNEQQISQKQSGFVPLQALLTGFSINKQQKGEYFQKQCPNHYLASLKQGQSIIDEFSQPLDHTPEKNLHDNTPQKGLGVKGSKYCTSQYLYQEPKNPQKLQEQPQYSQSLQEPKLYYRQEQVQRDVEKSIDKLMKNSDNSDIFDCWFKSKMNDMKQWKQNKLGKSKPLVENTELGNKTRSFYMPTNHSKSPHKQQNFAKPPKLARMNKENVYDK